MQQKSLIWGMCRPSRERMVQPLHDKGQRLEVSGNAGFNQHTTLTIGEASGAKSAPSHRGRAGDGGGSAPLRLSRIGQGVGGTAAGPGKIHSEVEPRLD